MADITQMQMEMAKRGLDQASRRIVMQRQLLRQVSDDARDDALRMLSDLSNEVSNWKRKIYLLEHGVTP